MLWLLQQCRVITSEEKEGKEGGGKMEGERQENQTGVLQRGVPTRKEKRRGEKIQCSDPFLDLAPFGFSSVNDQKKIVQQINKK